MSTLFVHQSPTLPQKIDSHEGWFWCKEEGVAHAGKMNIYVKQPSFTQFLGYLPLNIVQYAAKRIAIWCKT